MRAVRLHARGDLRVEEVAAPSAPTGDEVLLRIEAAGICGSDLHNYHTGMWISRAPAIPGHEFVATVADVGPAVQDLQPGDRVVADSRVPCQNCPACEGGNGWLCRSMGFVGEVVDGGFASQTLLKETQLLRLPDQSLAPEIAVLAEPLAVARHAVNRLAAGPLDRVLILGAGTIGTLCAIVLSHLGIRDLVVCDSNARRLARVQEQLGIATLPAGSADAGTFDACIDATGAAAGFRAALQATRRGGRISVVGIFATNIDVDMNEIVEGGLTILGCAAFNNELLQSAGLLSEIENSLRKLSTNAIGLDNVPDCYQSLLSGELGIQKAIIYPGRS